MELSRRCTRDIAVHATNSCILCRSRSKRVGAKDPPTPKGGKWDHSGRIGSNLRSSRRSPRANAHELFPHLVQRSQTRLRMTGLGTPQHRSAKATAAAEQAPGQEDTAVGKVGKVAAAAAAPAAAACPQSKRHPASAVRANWPRSALRRCSAPPAATTGRRPRPPSWQLAAANRAAAASSQREERAKSTRLARGRKQS